MLTSREVGEGGPYRTWLVPNDAAAAWQDVDLVVNSTIGYFLSLIGVRVPRLERFIDDAVYSGRLASPYYPGLLHAGYFLSRYYGATGERNNGARGKLGEVIALPLRPANLKNITSLEHAMAISSLIALGQAEMIDPAVVASLVSRLENEGFLPYAFCIDPAREGKQCYAGAGALTAAFCGEALARYSAIDSLRASTDTHPSRSYPRHGSRFNAKHRK